MMKKLLLTFLFGILGVGVYGQTIKTLGYNTTNGVVAYSGANTLTFTNGTRWNGQLSSSDLGADNLTIEGAIYFTDAVDTNGIATTRTNLGLGATWLTNTNVTNFRNAIGLGVLDSVEFTDITAVNILGSGNTNIVIDLDDSWLLAEGSIVFEWQTEAITFYTPIAFGGTNSSLQASKSRTNLGLPWSGLTNTNATNFRNAIGLGATWLTNTNVTNFRTAIGLGSTDNVILNEVQATFFVVADETNSQISFEGNSASTTRANLGLGATWLTNTDISSFREAINLGTNIAYFDKISMFTEDRGAIPPPPVPLGDPQQVIFYARGLSNNIVLNVATFGSDNYTVAFEERLGSWAKTTNASIARTNLGLGATWLTNTNAASFRAGIGVRDVIWKFKETNQTNNSGALTNDTVLSFTAAANTKYFVTLTLMFPSVVGQLGVSGKINATNGATVYGAHYSYDDGVGFTVNTFVQQSGTAITNESWIYQATDNVSTIGFVQVPFVVATGTNSTAVTFQFTKALSYTNAIIGAGSTLKAEIIE